MSPSKRKPQFVTTLQLAKRISVHPETVKRWIRSDKVPRPATDRRGWYIFDEEDVRVVERFANTINLPPHKLQGTLFELKDK